MEEITIKENNVGKRLDQFLQETYPEFSRSHIQNAISKATIVLERNGKILLKNGEKLKSGDKIIINITQPKQIDIQPQNMNIDIVYEDADLAVINKPQGLVVHPCTSCPSGTLVNGLLYQIKNLSGINGEIRPGIVHRIDKDTCGLLLVAKNDKAHVELSKQISNKTCSRKYLALIEGTFKEQEGKIQTLIGRDKKDRKKMAVVQENGRVAITEYKTVEYFDKYSLVEFSLKTGRTHQIRVHAKYLNHSIVGDITYGGAEKFGLKGQFLCAYKISFIHPTTLKPMEFEIKLPDNFNKILDLLRK